MDDISNLIFLYFVEDEDVNFFTDEWYLLRYLRFRKYDVDETYSTMKHFYRKKLKHPEVFKVPSNAEQLMNYHAFYYLPYADEEGRIVIVVDFGKIRHFLVLFLICHCNNIADTSYP